MPYNLQRFHDLNAEWSERPIVPRPFRQEPEEMAERARSRRQRMIRQLDLQAGQRVLEIGCGRGHLTRLLGDEAGVEAVGLDIEHYPEWDDVSGGGARFIVGDVAEPLGLDEQFDRIYSISVWEHLAHPAASLDQTFRLLKPGGVMFIQAQLLCGPKASHRYREVYFPWPHLLFRPEVFEEFYVSIGRGPRRPAMVHSWSALHYRYHLDRVGFETLWFSTPQPWFDQKFYDEHRGVLGIYPVWDLSHDAVMIRVRKPGPVDQSA